MKTATRDANPRNMQERSSSVPSAAPVAERAAGSKARKLGLQEEDDDGSASKPPTSINNKPPKLSSQLHTTNSTVSGRRLVPEEACARRLIDASSHLASDVRSPLTISQNGSSSRFRMKDQILQAWKQTSSSRALEQTAVEGYTRRQVEMSINDGVEDDEQNRSGVGDSSPPSLHASRGDATGNSSFSVGETALASEDIRLVSAYLVQETDGQERQTGQAAEERLRVEALERTIQQYQERDDAVVYASATPLPPSACFNRKNARPIVFSGVTISIAVVLAVILVTVADLRSSPTPIQHRVWQQVGRNIEGEAHRDHFGSSVALSRNGSYVAIGANNNDGINGDNSGHVRVFSWDVKIGDWLQVGQDIDGEAEGDQSGWGAGGGVAISAGGDRVAVGARLNSDKTGHVRVFDWDEESVRWEQAGDDLDGEYPGDEYGSSVSLSADGNRIAVGAGSHSNATGHVRVFDWDKPSTGWVQVGATIVGEKPGDKTGASVCLSADGSRLAVASSKAGFGQVYHRDNDLVNWTTMGQKVDLIVGFDVVSVTMSGNGSRVAFGEPMSNNRTGRVRVFDWDDASEDWALVGSTIHGENTGEEDWFGISASMSDDGTRMVIGAPMNDNNGNIGAGHVRVFDYDVEFGEWIQVGMDIDGVSKEDEFGYHVSISSNGQRIAMGASRFDGSAGVRTGVGQVYEFTEHWA